MRLLTSLSPSKTNLPLSKLLELELEKKRFKSGTQDAQITPSTNSNEALLSPSWLPKLIFLLFVFNDSIVQFWVTTQSWSKRPCRKWEYIYSIPRIRYLLSAFLTTGTLTRELKRTEKIPLSMYCPTTSKKWLQLAQKCRICAEGRSALIASSMQYELSYSPTLLRSYAAFVSKYLKNFGTDQIIAKYSEVLLRYI